jgi:hypothetical protein
MEFFPFLGQKQPKTLPKILGPEPQGLFANKKRAKVVLDLFKGVDGFDQ